MPALTTVGALVLGGTLSCTLVAHNSSGALEPKLIAILPSGSRLRALDCRASLCKVETTHLDLERYREFMSSGFSLETQMWKPRTEAAAVRQ